MSALQIIGLVVSLIVVFIALLIVITKSREAGSRSTLEILREWETTVHKTPALKPARPVSRKPLPGKRPRNDLARR